MFRRRLTVALVLLAIASTLQGMAALWALNVADHHSRHGRITSDIHLGFVELSATKQRLRTWVSQALLGAGAESAERHRLQSDLATKIEELRRLSAAAIELGTSLDEEDRRVQMQRIEKLDVLSRSFARLAVAIDAVQPLPPGANAQEAWNAVYAVFEVSEGQNLRELVADGIARAAASVQRERSAADRTLRWMRGLWLGTASALALAALLLAWHFVRALRHPLNELASGAAALQGGNLDHRIPQRGDDEFSGVARSVNAMAAELKQHRHRELQERLKLQELVDERTLELRDALSSLQQADERRRQLFVDISHELRTPTTAIRGEAEVALRGAGKVAGDYQEALKRIVEIARQLGLVINDILTMARSDIDTLALQRAPVDPAVALRDALQQIASMAQDRGVHLMGPAGFPVGLAVLGDAQRLRQLLLVLLDNAVLYSHRQGEVRVTMETVLDAQGRKQCEICIADQGIGIARDELDHIFDRNFRGAQARVHRADGTGLGLAIGGALARAHGGIIGVVSEIGLGTRVTLCLPLMTEPSRLLESA